MPYLFRSQRSDGRTPRPSPRCRSVDKPVMGAFCAGSYEVTPSGRSRATTSSAGPTDRPKDSNQRVRLTESQTRRKTSHPSSLAHGTAQRPQDRRLAGRRSGGTDGSVRLKSRNPVCVELIGLSTVPGHQLPIRWNIKTEIVEHLLCSGGGSAANSSYVTSQGTMLWAANQTVQSASDLSIAATSRPISSSS